RSPPLARRSRVGIAMGPPKVLGCPKPMSSIRTITTLGAPFGALISKRGGALALRASSSVIGLSCGSGIGRTARLRFSCAVNGAIGSPASTHVASVAAVRNLNLRVALMIVPVISYVRSFEPAIINIPHQMTNLKKQTVGRQPAHYFRVG